MFGQRYTTPMVTVLCPVTNLHHMASLQFASQCVIDARLSVNVLPSLYFQMCHHAMYTNNDHHLCM